MTNQFEPKSPIKNSFLIARDAERKQATDLEKGVADAQVARYETSLLRLMRRTKDNPELVNALKHFIEAMEHRSIYGNLDEQLSANGVTALVEFFNKSADELRWLYGGQTFDKSSWRKD